MYKASKAEEVFAYIKKQILSGEWKEGERLNDALLAEDIGVSRSSVREALFRLVETGVISKEYWKGYFIREITDQIVSEVVQVRIALESCAIRNFVMEASQEYIDELQRIIDASKVCLENQQNVEYMLTDYSFHEFIYQKQHNQKETRSDRNDSRDNTSVETCIEVLRIGLEFLMNELIEFAKILNQGVVFRLKRAEEP
jgi:DNA-binding GntR family transcriptional regulator